MNKFLKNNLWVIWDSDSWQEEVDGFICYSLWEKIPSKELQLVLIDEIKNIFKRVEVESKVCSYQNNLLYTIGVTVRILDWNFIANNWEKMSEQVLTRTCEYGSEVTWLGNELTSLGLAAFDDGDFIIAAFSKKKNMIYRPGFDSQDGYLHGAKLFELRKQARKFRGHNTINGVRLD